MTVSLRAPLRAVRVEYRERVAVQVHRMPHPGLVDEGQGGLLVLPDGERLVVRVGDR